MDGIKDNDQIRFGIGCFHFGLKYEKPFLFKWSDYKEEIISILSSVPEVSAININISEKLLKADGYLQTEPKNIQSGKFFPVDAAFSLQFELTLDAKAFLELNPDRNNLPFTQRYRINMHYWDYPITIVETLTKTDSPSSGVRWTREFLKKRVSNIPSFLLFECLGPSPFHYEFYLQKQTRPFEGDWKIRSEIFGDKGYKLFLMNFNSKYIKDSSGALKYILPAILEEFSYFYRYTMSNNKIWRSWIEISNQIRELLYLNTLPGLKGTYKRLKLKSPMIERLYINIALFESEILKVENDKHLQFNEVYEDNRSQIFKDIIILKMGKERFYETKQMAELISFFEKRRVENLNLWVSLMTAIIGGLVGSIITIYFQNN